MKVAKIRIQNQFIEKKNGYLKRTSVTSTLNADSN